LLMQPGQSAQDPLQRSMSVIAIYQQLAAIAL